MYTKRIKLMMMFFVIGIGANSYAEDVLTRSVGVCVGIVTGASMKYKVPMTDYEKPTIETYAKYGMKIKEMTDAYIDQKPNLCGKDMQERDCIYTVFKKKEDADAFDGYYQNLKIASDGVFSREDMVKLANQKCAKVGMPEPVGKAILKQEASGAKSANGYGSLRLVDYAIGKKWSIGEIPCNKNGGSYKEYTKNGGLVATLAGVKQPPMDKGTFKYIDVAPMAFIFEYQMLAKDNRMLRNSIPPNTVTMSMSQRIESLGPSDISVREETQMLDINALASKGVVRYDGKVETYLGHLCK